MPKYIKSHSNYRLSSKHQNVQDGKILERDITTVGGVSPFASNQTAIHSSGNFIIVINDTIEPTRHIEKRGWLSNDISGETWNAEVLANQTSDTYGSVETSIALKNDFMDFRSFACYGSLYDLVENSIMDLLDKFPYEAYTGTGGFKYSTHYLSLNVSPLTFGYSGDAVSNTSYEATNYFVEYLSSGEPASYVSSMDLYEISNPAGIDMHTIALESSESVTNPLRFFADGGYKNYSIFYDNTSSNPTDGYEFTWESDNNTYIINKSNVTDGVIMNVPSTQNFAVQFNSDVVFSKVKPTTTGVSYCYVDGVETTVSAKIGDTLYFRKATLNGETIYNVSDKYCPQPGDFVSKIKIYIPQNVSTIYLYAYRDEDLNVVYLVSKSNLFIHIRPKPSLSFYDNFVDSLNLFQKALIGYYSGIKYTSKFEVLTDNDQGTSSYVQTFVLPTTDGGYNIGGNGINMGDYISSLLTIGEQYDEKYTDNMYRSMTHESLKNLDWTRGFNGTDKDDDNTDYLLTGNKFKSVIRIMGYFFDQEKAYIDCLGNMYAVTYDNRSNLSDYFISDSLESDGWVVNNINTYTLTQVDGNSNIIDEEEWSELNQKVSRYKRLFAENVNEIIAPYDVKEYPQYYTCVSGNVTLETLDYFTEKEYYTDSNKNVHTLIKEYYTDKEYTMPDITNEFVKRLRINSRAMWRKKGTIEGIESMLALLGFRSRRWFEELDETSQLKYIPEDDETLPYDYEIYEYTAFANPIHEKWDPSHDMYRIDYLNSCKTVPYDTDSALNGIYISYQGLPVAYRDCEGTYLAMSADTSGNTNVYETKNPNDKHIYVNSNNELVKARYLYPYFDRYGIYDGDLYYQMNGGWLNYTPYSFDNNNRLVPNDDLSTNKETLRNVKQINNIKALLQIPQIQLYEGYCVYVTDVSTNYAIIDGSIYELYTEDISGTTYYYFTLTVTNGSTWIGGDLYEYFLDAYNPNNEDKMSHYYLPAFADGSEIKIYYNKDSETAYDIHGYTKLQYYHQVWIKGLQYTVECESTDDGAYSVYIDEIYPISPLAFISGSYHEDYSNYTHYFTLKDLSYSNQLGDDYWKQLAYTDSEYLRIAGVEDNLLGNNPHFGSTQYDSGYAYIRAFNRLFEYSIDGRYFDESSFDFPDLVYDELEEYGFSGICKPETSSYLGFLLTDSKSHNFADVIVDGLTNDDSGTTYTITRHTADGETIYTAGLRNYKLDGKESLSNVPTYANKLNNSSDSVTSQVMNTKVIELKFSLKANNFYKSPAQEQIKYIQTKIMPYVEQMIPSTAIVKISFDIYPYNFVTDADKSAYGDLALLGRYKDYFFFKNDGTWNMGE